MSKLLHNLISAFKHLPGVGEKSAQRMALHLLEKNRQGGQQLVHALDSALQFIKHCERCRNFTENDLCDLCASTRRSNSQLCIVETPADILSIEASGSYNGLYFVLMGRLSPLDGIGPNDLGLYDLVKRVHSDDIQELIFALGASMESEVTVQYIKEQLASSSAKMSRIAFGVPMGGSLEYVDANTLQHAFIKRGSVE